jgi:hypothetical protein
MRVRPSRAWLLCSLLGCLVPAPARAQASCEAQLHEAQELQYAGKLLLSRPLALACSGNASCEPQAQQACLQLLAALRRQIPSLVFSVRDERGNETDQVALFIDGELRSPALPTTPFELDPGSHELRLELPSGKSRALGVVLAPGEQLRRIELGFEPPGPPAKAPERRGGTPRWLTLSLGGLALASAGSFAYFASDGQRRSNDLQKGCAPACEPGPVSDMRRAFVVADISWIIAALAAGGATWSYLSESP